MYNILGKVRNGCMGRKNKGKIDFYEWEIVDRRVIILKAEGIS